MKIGSKAVVLVLAAVLCAGCTKQATVVTPPTTTTPSPNANLIEAVNNFGNVGCAVGATFVMSPAAVQWMTQTCPDAVTGITSIIQANGTLAQFQAIITTLKTTSAAIPGLSANDQKYITLALTLAQAAYTSYQEATGQTAFVMPRGAYAFVGSHKIKLTKEEKAKLAAIREKAKALKAKKRP